MNPTLQVCMLLRAGDDHEHAKNSTQAEKRMSAARTQAAFPLVELVTSSEKWAGPERNRAAQRLLAAGDTKQACVAPVAAKHQFAANAEFNNRLRLVSAGGCKVDKATLSFKQVLKTGGSTITEAQRNFWRT